MKMLLSLTLIAFFSISAQAQSLETLVKSAENLANANIPESASSVLAYTYEMEGCTLVKTTSLDDKTTYDVQYDLTKKLSLGSYDTEEQLYDIDIEDDEGSFVLAFKVEKDAQRFIKLLKKIAKKCPKG